MTCPACKNLMCNVDEKYECPACKGEFFTSQQAQQEDINIDWFFSKLLYPAAMRNEKETSRHETKHGFLRSAGRQREEWDANLYIR